MSEMEINEKRNFLITGASSGLGLAIASEALQRGHVVVGTARNIDKAGHQNPDFAERGGKWLQLDLTSVDTKEVVSKTIEEHGIDVLVNNGGSGLYGVFEDMSEEEIRLQMDTNFFGTLNVIQGAIPHFRRKRHGMIVTMSSISGLTVTSPSGLMYSASKAALEAVCEGLAMQLAPFGVQMLIVEPGLFRTNWLQGSYTTPEKQMTNDYVGGPIDLALRKYPTMHDKQQGDPAKAAKLILDMATGVGVGEREEAKGCLRLPLGIDAMDYGRQYIAKLTKNLDAMDDIARSAVFATQ